MLHFPFLSSWLLKRRCHLPSASDDTTPQVVFPPVPEVALGCCCALLVTVNVGILQGYGKVQQHKVLQVQVSERNETLISQVCWGKNEKQIVLVTSSCWLLIPLRILYCFQGKYRISLWSNGVVWDTDLGVLVCLANAKPISSCNCNSVFVCSP